MSGVGNSVRVLPEIIVGHEQISKLVTIASWSDDIIYYEFVVDPDTYFYELMEGANAEEIEIISSRVAFVDNFTEVTQNQQDAIAFILEADDNTANSGFSVEGFTSLYISENPGSGEISEIRFGNCTNLSGATVADFPGSAFSTSLLTSHSIIDDGDVWFGTQNPTHDYTNPTAGNDAWFGHLHETGHSLGLKHAHDTTLRGALKEKYDHMEYTVMTYRSYKGKSLSDDGVVHFSNDEWDFAQTYMIGDIAALQYLYGADFETNSGTTIYKWTPNSGTTFVNGEAAILPGGNRIFATIWDGGGTDTYDLSAYNTDLSINLTPGGSSKFSDLQIAKLGDEHFASGNIYNAFQYEEDIRSLIENAIGGSGNDTLIGNQANNSLDGGRGNDTLTGGAGDDHLIGGDDTDTAVYTHALSFYTITYQGGETYTITSHIGDEGTDTLQGIEQVQFDGLIYDIDSVVSQPEPSISVSSTGAVTEGGQLTFVVTLSSTPTEDVSFSYSTFLSQNATASMGDFSENHGIVTISAGHEGPFYFVVDTTTDGLPEGLEYLNVQITDITNAVQTDPNKLITRGYILDGDSTRINFPDSEVSGTVDANGDVVYSIVTDGNGGLLTVDLKGLSSDARVVVLDYQGNEITSEGFSSNNPGTADEQVRIPYGNIDTELYFIKIIGGTTSTDFSLHVTNDVIDISDETDITVGVALDDFDNDPAFVTDGGQVVSSDVSFGVGTNIGENGSSGTPQDRDVFVSSILHSGTVKDDAISEVVITVENTSNAALTSRGRFFVAISSDGVLSSDDQIIVWQDTYQDIDVNASLTGILEIDWAELGLSGDQFIIAGYYNDDDPVQSNNYIAKEVTIIPDSFSDVGIVRAGGDFGDLVAGGEISVSALIKNNGDIASGSSTLSLLVNDGSGWVQIASETVVSLNGGSITVKTVTGTIPSGYTGALQTKLVITNSSDDVSSNNELIFDTVDIDPLPVDDIDPGGTSIVGAEDYTGSIDTITDTDSFNISVVNGGIYRIEMSEYQYFHFALFDVQGGYQHSLSSLGNGAYQFQADSTGTYRFEISSNGVFTGDYTISISDNVAGAPVYYTNGNDNIQSSYYVSQTHYLLAGRDFFKGGIGSRDTVFGGDGRDNIDGRTENDVLYGEAGNDYIKGGSGNDLIYGGEDNDTLLGENGNDRVYGGSGNDTFYSGTGYNHLYGGSGNDNFYTDFSNRTNYIDGGTGVDTVDYDFMQTSISVNLVTGSVTGDIIGGDTLTNIENIHLGQGNDAFIGNASDNLVFGWDGHDTISGGLGNDRLYGNDGNDIIHGNDGNDRLVGGNGTDQLYGDTGDDVLRVGTLDGDVFFGGEGNDTAEFYGAWADYSFSISGDTVLITDLATSGTLQVSSTENFNFSDMSVTLEQLTLGAEVAVNIISSTGQIEGSAGDDWIVGSNGIDAISGNSGDDQIFGYAEDDYISGGLGNDELHGGAGSDTLSGSIGDDIIFGENGADTINGGAGINLLTGGAGADEFVFNTLTSQDTITDFEIGVDTVNLRNLFRVSESVSMELNGMGFHRVACFVDYDVDSLHIRFVQNGNDTEVYFDFKGTRDSLVDAAPSIVLEGIDLTALTFDDFIF